MICLVLDTAGTACAACLYDSDQDIVLSEISEEIGKGHAERLMDIISEVMASAKVTYKDIDRIVTTTGPGSFTGIRVGVATARGFGVGLKIPVIGISNLEAMLYQFGIDKRKEPGGEKKKGLGVSILAGRGQAYCLFDFDTELAPANEPFVAELDALQKELSNYGQNFSLCGTAAPAILGANHPTGKIADKDYKSASLAVVARLGAKSIDILKKPEPLYLRKPDAVPQKGFAVERAE